MRIIRVHFLFCLVFGFCNGDVDTGIFLHQPNGYRLVAVKNEPISLNCSVTSDSPLTFTWFKNGRPFILDDHKRIQMVKGSLDFRRILNRPKKNITDEGVYECHAKNKYGTVIATRIKLEIIGVYSTSVVKVLSVTAEVKVPSVAVVEKGKSVILKCPFDSSCSPVIWQKEDGQMIRSSHRLIGSKLKMQKVIETDSGMYNCSMKSTELPELEARVEVKVQTKPRVLKRPHDKKYPRTRTVRFHCEFSGTPSPNITWYKNGKQIVIGGRVRIVHKSTLIIVSSELSDSGYYQCIGENDLGYATAVARLNIYSPVGEESRPCNVTAFAISEDAINVYWNYTQSKNVPPVLAYLVILQESNKEELFPRKELVHGGSHLLIEELNPNTEYTLYVRAYTNKGASAKSNTAQVRTKALASMGMPPASPTNLQIIPLSLTAVNVVWQYSADDSPDTSFKLTITKLLQADAQQTHKISDHSVTSYNVTDLKSDTSYGFSLVALNDYGESGRVFQKFKTPSSSPQIELQDSNCTSRAVLDILNNLTANIYQLALSINITHTKLDELHNRQLDLESKVSRILISNANDRD